MALTQIVNDGLGASLTATSEGGAVTTSIQQGLAKHWSNFDGSGTVSTRESFNQSSLTDNAVGNYTIAIASAMDNANYVMQGSASDTNTDAPSILSRVCLLYPGSVAPTTSQYKLATGYSYYTASAFYDTPYNFTEIKGDLA